VAQLKRDFPHWAFILNGGLTQTAQLESELQRVDGVMIGRAAYHDPWSLREWEAAAYACEPRTGGDRTDVEAAMVRYMSAQAVAHGTSWTSIARHMMGLHLGLPGARRWRQVWSDHRLRDLQPAEVAQRAQQALGLDTEPSLDAMQAAD
jgi:tRNA-dihydrouridine synthase A